MKVEETEKKNGKPFPIVGLGASAGGLEALEGFVSHLPSNVNIPFVIIQHLSPKYKSIMPELLKKYTPLRIFVIEEGMKIEPNCIYLNPPNKYVSLIHCTFQLTEPGEAHGPKLSIDHFFRSLSEERGEKAICVVLSGTGTDGTLGLKAVKSEGGMTMAQDELQAKYNGMPRSAIETGLVDYVLTVEKMPGEIIKYVEQPYIKGVKRPVTHQESFRNFMHTIFTMIQSETGHDFSNYKPNTIHRRIERRMAVHHIEKISHYVDYLRQYPAEIETLYKDLLIGVTNFFRDPEAFDILKEKVLVTLLKNRPLDSPVRIWVPGCATGEEAFSIAIIMVEIMEKMKKCFDVQIFATDIDAEVIDRARLGLYPDSIAAHVSKSRLDRFFIKEDNAYKIKRQIREMVVFAVQNLIKDPAFSRLDLVSCRNVLIYLNIQLQKRIIPLFHYVLKKRGFLFLGTSEGIGEFTDYFLPVDLKWKIFKREGVVDEKVALGERALFLGTDVQKTKQKVIPDEVSISELAEKLILENYAPPCVIINEKYEILFFYGQTERYLSPPTGVASFNILKMVREDLRYQLTIALQEAIKQKTEIVTERLKTRYNDEYQTINIVVKPIMGPTISQELLMVAFEDKTSSPKSVRKEKEAPLNEAVDPRLAALEQELKSTREYLQTTIEELETSNEEMKSANEELQSTNEELQSTNEELETSKEELQSTNEELQTVNSEHQDKITELSHANNDLHNLLASTEIGTIFLDTNLCIKRFTPSVSKIFNLISSDIGRPISDITSTVIHEDIYQDAKDVLNTLKHFEVELQVKDGNWFSLRIQPYRTEENLIDGIVVTFVDITKSKKAQERAEESENYAKAIFDTIRGPILVLDDELKVVSANRSFYSVFHVTVKEIVGNFIYSLSNNQWDIPAFRELLEKVLPHQRAFNNYRVEREFPSVGQKTVILNARQLVYGNKKLILLAFEDVTPNRESI
ncbi:MAG: chemotaxis protein CheR [Candidatus Scalindua sp.]|nr:MAG: chemotaxis protein CheR [Candidatus Scalindua sp.]